MYERKHKRLRGGWDVGPEEYKSMGFTIGLPPNIYVPQNPEIQKLSNKFENSDKDFNKIDSRFSVTERQTVFEAGKFTRCFANALPPNINEQYLKQYVNQYLYQNGHTTNPNAASKVTINQQGHFAFIDFTESADADKFLELKDAFQIDGYTLRIRKSTMSGSNDVTNLPPERPDSIIIRNIGELYNEIDIEKMKETIQSICNQYAEASSIEIPFVDGFSLGYCIIDLVDKSLVDYLCMRLKYGHNYDASRCFKKIGQEPRVTIASESGQLPYYETDRNSSYFSCFDDVDMNIADILNLDIGITRIEANLIPSTSKFLKIYNVIRTHSKKEIATVIEDMKKECEAYGKVVNAYADMLWITLVPQLNAPIIVQFESSEDARRAQFGISGRTYCGRVVITCNEDP